MSMPSKRAPPLPSALAKASGLFVQETNLGGGAPILRGLIGINLVGMDLVEVAPAYDVGDITSLAGATLGWVYMPGPPLEAVIALSIAFVAAEIIHGRQGKPGLTERYPWVVAFTFGLLHGFGFAGALTQVGLPQVEIPLALLFFNVVVEVCQLLFISAVFAAVWIFHRVVRHMRLPRVRGAPALSSYLIGGLAMFWVIERTVAFFP